MNFYCQCTFFSIPRVVLEMTSSGKILLQSYQVFLKHVWTHKACVNGTANMLIINPNIVRKLLRKLLLTRENQLCRKLVDVTLHCSWMMLVRGSTLRMKIFGCESWLVLLWSNDGFQDPASIVVNTITSWQNQLGFKTSSVLHFMIPHTN